MTGFARPLRLAIVGGGFTGAALATHGLTAATQPLSVDVIEPSAKLGRGAAYATTNADHRINVPSDRMSLFSSDPTHFTRWLFDNKWLPDPESADPLGRCFVPRDAFAAYSEAGLEKAARSATSASLRHRQTRVVGLIRENDGFRVTLADRTSLHVDRVAICTGHVPSAPCSIREGAARHPRFIANPWAPDSLATIRRSDSVLIVGAGLTMVDVVATLARTDHQGPIVAISQRGLLPRGHGRFVDCAHLFEGVRPATALELLRLVRAEIRQCDDELDWQAVVDALRRRLPEIWPALPALERIRAVRRLLHFWDVHRFRIAPQGAAAVAGLTARGTLKVQRARAIEVDARQESLLARLRLPDGTIVDRAFHSIILCSGASRNIRDNLLLANLIDGGLAQDDDVNIGLKVDGLSRLIDARGATQPHLFAFGPITRGTFGEMTGAPDIIGQIERVIPTFVEVRAPIQTDRLRTLASYPSGLVRP
ncbi:MAG TPA: FAD/NAD(P)-binding protein [Roseiarcus sp.]